MCSSFFKLQFNILYKVGFSSDFNQIWSSKTTGVRDVAHSRLIHVSSCCMKGMHKSIFNPLPPFLYQVRFSKYISIIRFGVTVHINNAAVASTHEVAMYHESVAAMRKIGLDCIEKKIKAVSGGEEVPNDILTQMLQGCSGCD